MSTLSSSLILKARVVVTDINFLLPGEALLQGFEIKKVPGSSEEMMRLSLTYWNSPTLRDTSLNV